MAFDIDRAVREYGRDAIDGYERERDSEWDRDDLADRLEDQHRADDGWRAAPSSGSSLGGYW